MTSMPLVESTPELFAPVVARTRSVHRAVGPVAYDCVKVVVIRHGTAILFSEFGQKPARPGDVLLLAPNTLCSSEPEGHVTVTTVSLDSDYLLDQMRWQYAGLIEDRLDAQAFAETICTEPAQMLRLGEDRAGMLAPWLDELVSLSIEQQFARDYFRIQALWFSITHVIAPFIMTPPVRFSPSRRAHIRPTLPRDRRFAPLRAEARQAATLLREAPGQRWTLEALAEQVHLSSSQLARVFVEAYGKTPLAFLTMVRAELLARYLRESDLPIAVAIGKVGWHSRSHATELFRRCVGLTPGQYRRRRS